MKLTLEHHHLRSTDELDSLIEERILALQPRLQIDEVNVRLECRHEASPPFSVRIHLVTPGPNLIAEDRDHTLGAALVKVMSQLESALAERVQKRRRRVRDNLQEPTRMRGGQSRR